jgi:hypothetical protein
LQEEGILDLHFKGAHIIHQKVSAKKCARSGDWAVFKFPMA